MKRLLHHTLFFLLSAVFVTYSCNSSKNPVVTIYTSQGNICLEIDTVNAPVTAGNFLYLCQQDVYENGVFYRTVTVKNQPYNKVKIEVIQGGLYNDSLINLYTPILHETTDKTGIKHLDGTISMARLGPGTASTEFFICIGDQPELDFGGKRNPDEQGFAAFGQVKKGMDLVREIQGMENLNQYLVRPLQIDSIKILN